MATKFVPNFSELKWCFCLEELRNIMLFEKNLVEKVVFIWVVWFPNNEVQVQSWWKSTIKGESLFYSHFLPFYFFVKFLLFETLQISK